MPGKKPSLSEMEKDIEIYQNDRSPVFDRRMYDQPDEEQVLRYPSETEEDKIELYRQASPVLEPETKDYLKSRGYSKGDMVCKGKGKAIRGYKFGGCR